MAGSSQRIACHGSCRIKLLWYTLYKYEAVFPSDFDFQRFILHLKRLHLRCHKASAINYLSHLVHTELIKIAFFSVFFFYILGFQV